MRVKIINWVGQTGPCTYSFPNTLNVKAYAGLWEKLTIGKLDHYQDQINIETGGSFEGDFAGNRLTFTFSVLNADNKPARLNVNLRRNETDARIVVDLEDDGAVRANVTMW